jgi:tetratricopeptide (TPR) repeat protein
MSVLLPVLRRYRLVICWQLLLAFACCSVDLSPTFSQDTTEESESQKLAERYLSVLERNPQRGTAFDKVIEIYPTNEQLVGLIERYSKRANDSPDDFSALMMVGLLEQYRQSDASAIAAFSKASQLKEDSPLAWISLGECYRDSGEAQKAIEAFERAMKCKLNRASLVDICEQTGRLYLRMNQSQRALEVWKKIEEQFPDDVRTLERIANTLKQENAFAEAITRFEKLATLTKDDFQKTQYQIAAAQIRIELGEKEKGLSELESILTNLKPDSWLYADVQTKVEDVFINASDQDGLVDYYKTRLAKRPDDIETMVRLAKFLDASARLPEAYPWIEKAIQLAPTRAEYRKQWIQMLVAEKKTLEAEEQYAKLAAITPEDTEMYRQWGSLILQDENRTPEDAKKDAAAVWRRIVEVRPTDSVLHISVAMLLQSSGLSDEARKLYERAVELSPNKPEYREYLGEFLYATGKREEAFAAWEESVEREQRSASSLASIAEVYARAREFDIASDRIMEACSKNPRDAGLWLQAATLHSKARRSTDALNSLDQAERNAISNDQREKIITERIELLVNNQLLENEIETLREQLKGEGRGNALKWQKLGRYLIRLERWDEAELALSQSLAIDDRNTFTLNAQSSIALHKKQFQRYIDLLRKLSKLDRRNESDYIKRIAKQQIVMGNKKQAIETANELLNIASSKVDANEFLSTICFQAGEPVLGTEALRRALAVEPGSPGLMMNLAAAYVTRKDLDAAEKLYWKAFAKSRELDSKLDLTVRLVDLHKQKRTIKTLIENFQQRRKSNADYRDMTICLAQVYQSAGDLKNAKETLQGIVNDRTRDTRVLKQFVDLCEASHDMESAVAAQRRFASLVQDDESIKRLVALLWSNGEWVESNELLTRQLQKSGDMSEVIKEVDALIVSEQWELIQQVLEPLVKKEPDNWELLYRMAIAKCRTEKRQQARELLEQILLLKSRQDDVAYVRKKTTASTDQDLAENAYSVTTLEQKIRDARSLAFDIASIVKGENRLPKNFGETQVASIVWLLYCDIVNPETQSRYLARLTHAATKETTSPSSLARDEWLHLFLATAYRKNLSAQISSLAALSQLGDTTAKEYLLKAVRARQFFGNTVESDSIAPLPAWQLDALVDAFRSAKPVFEIQAQVNELEQSRQRSASLSMSYSMAMMGMSPPSSNPTEFGIRLVDLDHGPVRQNGFAATVCRELQLAGKADMAEEMLARVVQESNSVLELYSICEQRLDAGKIVGIKAPLLKAMELLKQQFLQRASKQEAASDAKAPGNLTGVVPGTVASVEVSPIARIVGVFERLESIAIDACKRDSGSIRLDDKLEIFSKVLDVERDLFLSGSRFLNQFATLAFQSENELSWATSSAKTLEVFTAIKQAPVDSSKWTQFFQQRIAQSEGAEKAVEQIRAQLFLTSNIEPLAKSQRVSAIEEIGSFVGCSVWSAQYLNLLGEKEKADRILILAFDTGHLTINQHSLLNRLFRVRSGADVDINATIRVLHEAAAQSELDPAIVSSMAGLFSKAGKANEFSYLSRIVALRRGQSSSATLTQSQQLQQAQQQQQLQLQLLQIQQAQGNIRQTPSYSIGARQTIPQIPSNFRPNTTIISRSGVLQSKGNEFDSIRHARKVAYTSPSSLMYSLATRFYSVQQQSLYLSFLQSSSNQLRSDAIVYLKQQEALDEVIQHCQRQLLSQPNSFENLQLLAELVLIKANDNSGYQEVEQLLRKMIQLRPRSAEPRLQLLGLLLSKNTREEARQELLELFKIDPSAAVAAISLDSSLIGDESKWLAAANQVRWELVANDSHIVDSAIAALRLSQGSVVGITVLEEIAKLSPSHRREVYERAFAMKHREGHVFDVATAVLPTAEQTTVDPWFGFHSSAPLHANEAMLFDNSLDSLSAKDLDTLEARIQKHMAHHPAWLGGKLMLAILAHHSERAIEATERFASLLEDIEKSGGCPDSVAWRLGKVAWKESSDRRVVIELLQRFVGRPYIPLPDEEHPHVALASLLFAEDQRVPAIELLKSSIRLSSATSQSAMLQNFGGSNQYITTYQYSGVGSRAVPGSSGNTEIELAKKLLATQMPVDAYRVMAQAPVELETSSKQSRSKLEKTELLNSTKKLLHSLEPKVAIKELLLDRTIPQGKPGSTGSNNDSQALELMIEIPTLASYGNSDRPVSESHSTLIKLARDGSEDEILSQLDRLQANHPGDLTVLVTQARIRLALGRQDADASLQTIDRLISNDSSDGAYPGQMRQNRSEVLVALWLVASDCYDGKRDLEIADRIAQYAVLGAARLEQDLQSASTQSARTSPIPGRIATPNTSRPSQDPPESDDLSYLLLLDWGRKIAESGNSQRAAEIFQIAASAVDPALDNPKQRTSLSIGQFNKIVRIASVAGKQGNVPFAKQCLLSLTRRTKTVFNAHRNAAEAREIEAIVNRWGMANASDRYDVLVSLVLPEHQSTIHEYISDSSLLADPPASVAASLVKAAAEAGMLEDLLQRLDAIPKTEPRSDDLLRTLVAIEKKDTNESQSQLKRMLEVCNASEQVTIAKRASHVAIPALEVEELQEYALPILERYLSLELATGSFPPDDFKLFPLPQKVDDFIQERAKRKTAIP